MARKSNFKGAMKAALESGVLRKTDINPAPSPLEAQEDQYDTSHPPRMSTMTGPSGSSERQVMTTDKKDAPKWFKLGNR